MKKICFLTDSVFTIGGVQRVTAVIAKELAKDHAVTIVTLDNRDGYNPALYGLGSTDITFRFFSYPTLPRWKQKLYKVYSGLYRNCRLQTKLASDLYAHSSFPADLRKALLKELKAGDYDVIIGVHAPLAVRLAACRKALKGVRLIGWIHNSYQALFGKDSLYHIGPELQKHYEWQLDKLDATVVLCHDDARKYHIRTEVIYNPLTLTPGAPSQGTSEKFLAVGRFARLHKGFDLLIEAFHIFAQQNDDWTLDIVGEGVEEPLYRNMIKEYQLEDRITIHPFTDHIQKYYSEAQVYVLSSRWEGMPLVLMEAMAHGLPIVASDLPICKEIMQDSCLYFSNGDVNGLARQMHEATRIDWRTRSGESIRIAQRFSVDAIIQQWHRLLGASVSSK